jgi:hypothetical protein
MCNFLFVLFFYAFQNDNIIKLLAVDFVVEKFECRILIVRFAISWKKFLFFAGRENKQNLLFS